MINTVGDMLKNKVLEMLCKKHGFSSIEWESLNPNANTIWGLHALRGNPYPSVFCDETANYIRITQPKLPNIHPLDALLDMAKHSNILENLFGVKGVFLRKGTTLEQLAIELDLDGKQDD